MQYGVLLPNFGILGDAEVLGELAAATEQFGWDGVFLWDHLEWPEMEPVVDPWVALAVVAMQTQRVRLGTLVTPVARRDLAKLARETVSIDRLSNGRLVLGVGLGWETIPEWDSFGHETDAKVRGDMLDEALDVLAALWSGGAVDHSGAHYQIATAGQAPPVQQPRIPIWVGGGWPAKRPFRRAARWDGAAPISADEGSGGSLTPADVTALTSFIGDHRTSDDDFDVVVVGRSADGEDDPAAFGDAGATWWLESLAPWGRTIDDVRATIEAGPPR